MTDLWFDYIPVRIRGGRKYERLYLFIRYKSAQEMDAVRQLHAQKSARNEEVPRRRRTRKTTEPERSAAAVSVAEPLGDELFTMTVTRAVRVLESRARSQTLQEKISPELYSAVSSVLVYTARLLTNTNSEKREKQAQETRDALNRILAQQHDLTCWALGMARMMLTKRSTASSSRRSTTRPLYTTRWRILRSSRAAGTSCAALVQRIISKQICPSLTNKFATEL